MDESSDIKWHVRFMDLAAHVAEWSKDPSTKVGAVIVDEKRRIVSLGYNGFPRGVVDDPDRYADRPVKYKLIVHSEANAILNANVILDGCTLYSTKFPCTDCTKLIVQSGLKDIYSPVPNIGEVWTEDAEYSRQMMMEVGIGVNQLAITSRLHLHSVEECSGGCPLHCGP